MKKLIKRNQGFTLIELLVVIGIIAVLAAVVLIAINPARQFAQARDAQRNSNVNAILNAVGQNMADNQGVFTCPAGDIPTSTTQISSAGYNLYSCIVPTYISEMPVDPRTGNLNNPPTDYNTGYEIMRDAGTGRITVSANGEITPTISVTR